MLLYVINLYIVTIFLHILVVEDKLQVYIFEVECSMVVFIERPDEVGSLSCLFSMFVYIKYLRLELISAVILSIVAYPMP
jgi:hypothetical protein